ncbi:MAG: hypothetical protein EA381_06915 [Planctomycetaceae bacterium]|nr:MAG: hypothetical protein EA381_06915 [Planctomycetaceae bacterium]
MVANPEAAFHTSAYDRCRSERAEAIDSAAFDLVPIETAAAGKETREAPVAELKAKRRAKKYGPENGWHQPEGPYRPSVDCLLALSDHIAIPLRS